MSGAAPWKVPLDQLLSALSTDPGAGLGEEEARARFRRDGPNQLQAAQKTSKLSRFLFQFKSPVIFTLIVATTVSAALGEWFDAAAIVTIVVLNAIVGYLQEGKAEAAVEALKKLAAPKARVIRGGQIREIPATEVASGDVLVVEAGDYVAADARLISASQLSADEAVLTGESLPVKKTVGVVPADSPLGDRNNMLFGGTSVATGSGRAVVTAIGMSTEIGKIAGMLEDTQRAATPLQSLLEDVSSKLLLICLGVVAIVGLLGFVHGETWLNVLMSGISLAVAAVPEGLPAVVTLALAFAIRRMARRKAIVRHLPAVETLGSTDVICTDKTGTLTTGKMRVRELVFADGEFRAAEKLSQADPSRSTSIALASALCSNASLSPSGEATGDPTEVALLLLAKDLDVRWDRGFERLAEWSFDSIRKRMSVLVRHENGETWIYCKGAPEAVLPRCLLVPSAEERIQKRVQKLSSEGRRLLAVARRKSAEEGAASQEAEQIEQGLEFLGLVSIADPPRPEAIQAIQTCKAAGILVVMITGDHPATAKAIGSELGIVEPGRFDGVLTGPELESLDDEEFKRKVVSTAVYARVTPEHKLRIVEAWKAYGKVVAMTGDGVNDAPALKAASIGISMGKGGTEVARQASSMILADDNFATIVSAVEEGRAIYGNIRRTIQYLLSGNLAEILIMLAAAVAGLPVPLEPIHLLWINLVTDGLPSLALAAEPVPAKVLQATGRPSPRTLFDRSFYREMTFIGVAMATMAFAVYAYSIKHESEITARTHVFTFLVFGELFRSFACRSETRTFFQVGPFSNAFHLIAVAIPISFQVFLNQSQWFERIFNVRRVSGTETIVMIGLTLVPVTAVEVRKWIRQRRVAG